jgi:hypothetical protein
MKLATVFTVNLLGFLQGLSADMADIVSVNSVLVGYYVYNIYPGNY